MAGLHKRYLELKESNRVKFNINALTSVTVTGYLKNLKVKVLDCFYTIQHILLWTTISACEPCRDSKYNGVLIHQPGDCFSIKSLILLYSLTASAFFWNPHLIKHQIILYLLRKETEWSDNLSLENCRSIVVVVPVNSNIIKWGVTL